MENKTTHSLKSLINDLFSQVYNDEIIIPDAVNQMTNIIENFNDYNVNSKIDPLFDYGKLPLLKYYKVMNIKFEKNNGYQYFLYNENNPDLSVWLSEDKLLNLLKNEQVK